MGRESSSMLTYSGTEARTWILERISGGICKLSVLTFGDDLGEFTRYVIKEGAGASLLIGGLTKRLRATFC